MSKTKQITPLGTSYELEAQSLSVKNAPLSILYYDLPRPKAVFVCLHGMLEHKERYQYFIEQLINNGYAAVIYDHRGHGQSVASKADLGNIGSSNLNALVDDAAQITHLAKLRYPDTKIVLFGHSMGSLVARMFLKTHDDMVDACILSGQPCERFGVEAGIAIAAILEKVKGPKAKSRILDMLTTGSYARAIPGGNPGAWLSENEENVRKYLADPLCTFRFTVNSYRHLLNLQKQCYSKTGWELKNSSLPIFIAVGSDDPCAGKAINVKNTVMSLKGFGYKNVFWKRYKGLRHEILNEDAKDRVISDMLVFVKKYM